MSTYAVFGMTYDRAYRDAKKHTLEVQKRNGATYELTPAEWMEKVVAAAEQTMASTRVVQLSENFDAPQYAERFMELAWKDRGRGLHIKAHTKTGEVDPKTRKPIVRWVLYKSTDEQVIEQKLRAGTLL